MGKVSKRSRKIEESDNDLDYGDFMEDDTLSGNSNEDHFENGDADTDEGESAEDYFENADADHNEEESEEDHFENADADTDEGESDDFEVDDEEEGQEGHMRNDDEKNAEIEELEKEYMDLRYKEQSLLKNLKLHKDEDFLKGQAVKNQRAMWDKTLEFRFLLQKGFSSSNRLPKEPVRSLFFDLKCEVSEAYSDLISSAKNTLDSMLGLQTALVEKNPSIAHVITDVSNVERQEASSNLNEEDEDWLRISQMHSRLASFRDKSIDKWQRKTQVTTGAAAFKGKLQAFNQNISQQVANYMRDPSRMIKGMQQSKAAVTIFGADLESKRNDNQEVTSADGDAELLDDSEFYQQLLKEFFETIDPASAETAIYALKKQQPKKRKIVDRRASKSRKIRYHVHEKIQNFMAPQRADIPPMAPKLFENLFGLKTNKTTSVA